MSIRRLLALRAPLYLQKAQNLGLLPNPYANGLCIDDDFVANKRTVVGVYTPSTILRAPFIRPRESRGYDIKLNIAGDQFDRSVSFGFYDLEDVRIWPRFGVHSTSIGVLKDYYCYPALTNPKYEIPRLFLPLAPTRSFSEGVYLGPSFYHNFYHWMIDIVPRLSTVAHLLGSGLPLFVPRYINSVQNDVLKFALRELDLEGIQIVRLGGAPCRFDRLVMPTAMSAPLDVSPAQRSFLRDIIPEVPTGRKKRIYISRRDAQVRRITNEIEIQSLLNDYGFETVTLSEKSIEQQANIFRGAEAIVAHHGAGLTNLAFCSPSTLAIEIFHDGHFSPSFARLAQLGELKYGFGIGDPVGSDTWLDPNQLRELLESSELDRR